MVKSRHMYTKNSLIAFSVMSGIFFFCILSACCRASDKKLDCLEQPTVGAKGGASVRVLWTVSAYHIGKSAVWGKTEAQDMLFEPLDISTSSITFDGQTCQDVTFESEIVDAAKYLAEGYQTTPQTFGFEEKTLRVIKTNCFLPGFSEYMRLMDRRLIVPINGVLFVFEPAVNY